MVKLLLQPPEEHPTTLYNRFGFHILLKYQIFNFALDDIIFVMLVYRIYIITMLLHNVMKVNKNKSLEIKREKNVFNFIYIFFTE